MAEERSNSIVVVADTERRLRPAHEMQQGSVLVT
jgi:hypothetical protein